MTSKNEHATQHNRHGGSDTDSKQAMTSAMIGSAIEQLPKAPSRLHARGLCTALIWMTLASCTNDSAPIPEPDPDLRDSLSASMSDARVLRYADTWNVLAEGATVAPGVIRLFYTRRVIPAINRASGDDQGKGDYWNREHVWPQSYGIAGNDARTDVHNLVPVDRTVNSSRGNRLFDEAPTPHHECIVCRAGTGIFEPGPEEQGDVARIAFYMDTRYEGQGGVPDLVLADDGDSNNARFGVLSTLIRWHCADPISAEEMQRHEAAVAAQGNRNTFVDSPELAGDLYGFTCS